MHMFIRCIDFTVVTVPNRQIVDTRGLFGTVTTVRCFFILCVSCVFVVVVISYQRFWFYIHNEYS